MEYNVRLTKIKSNHQNLRTDVIEGVAIELPEKGKNFTLVGPPFVDGANCRVVTTTEIQSIECLDSEYLFHTLNSSYKLEVLK